MWEGKRDGRWGVGNVKVRKKQKVGTGWKGDSENGLKGGQMKVKESKEGTEDGNGWKGDYEKTGEGEDVEVEVEQVENERD